jgi:hypothetical protein
MTDATKLADALERPIIFSGEMVRAILDGRKTQTRRVCKEQPKRSNYLREATSREAPRFVGQSFIESTYQANVVACIECPYGQPGDRLWVRETWRVHSSLDSECPSNLSDRLIVDYRAGGTVGISRPGKWRPSIHMPRKFCRLVLEVKAVRVERLQNISQKDAKAEGMTGAQPDLKFADLWNSLNAKRGYGWRVNPWVWVIEFAAVEGKDDD